MIKTSVRVPTNKDASAAVDRATRRHMVDGASVGFAKSQDIIAAEATDTGNLLRSGVPPEVQNDGSVIWGYLAEYAEDVNEGQDPHHVPFNVLARWAMRTFGISSKVHLYLTTIGVQRKIEEEGTRGVHFMERSVTRMRQWFGAKSLGAYLEVEL